MQLPAVAEFDYQGEAPHRMRPALARRSISKPDEIACYLAYAPLGRHCREVGEDRRVTLGDRGVCPGSTGVVSAVAPPDGVRHLPEEVWLMLPSALVSHRWVVEPLHGAITTGVPSVLEAGLTSRQPG